MKDWDELLEKDEEDSVGEKIIRFGLRHGGIVAFVVVVVALIVSVNVGRSIWAENKQLKTQVDDLQYNYNVLKESHQELSDSVKKVFPVITSTLIEDKLDALSDLVTQEYVYTNADRSEEDKPWIFGWTQPFGKKSLMITYDGTIKAGINLREAKIEVDKEGKTIRITLPQSRITDNIIPEETVEILESKDGLFNEVQIEDYQELIENQKIIMQQKAIDRGLLEKADKEARSIVKDFLSDLSEAGGYKLEVSTKA